MLVSSFSDWCMKQCQTLVRTKYASKLVNIVKSLMHEYIVSRCCSASVLVVALHLTKSIPIKLLNHPNVVMVEMEEPLDFVEIYLLLKGRNVKSNFYYCILMSRPNGTIPPWNKSNSLVCSTKLLQESSNQFVNMSISCKCKC